ncbi:MAG TPA: amino acid permease [Candidatus Limnocylindrales bacterium]|jgi:amino acid transporter
MAQRQTREEAIRADVKDLHGLGYAQELYRTMGGFSNFAISFSIISILTGAVILYDYGLAWAGTAAVLIGWPLVTVFVLFIAASMSEIASAYPTAGGLYYWASRMKNKDWGWWTAWFNLIGQFAIVAGIAYAAAQFLNVSIVTPLLSKVGVTFDNTSVVLANGSVPILSGALVTMGVLLAICLVLNIAGINLVALLNQVSVWWHMAIVAAVVVLVFFAGKPDASGLTLFKIQPLDTGGSWANVIGPINLSYGAASTYPVVLALFFSLLQANWTYTGYDASAHVAEETVGARVSSAWGLFLSVAVSAAVGYIFLLALTTHLPNLSTLFPPDLTKADPATYSTVYFGGGYAVYETLRYNLATLGELLGAGIAIAMSFCTLSSVASAGRMLFAFARDDGVPGSGILRKVSHRYRTPINALVAIVVVAFLFTVAAFYVGGLGGPGGGGIAIVIITAISTIFLYAAYGIVIYLGATTTDWLKERVWSLGRWSKLSAWLAIFWIIVLMILFSFPTSGNISWPFMVGTVALLVVYFFAWARSRFNGPKVMGREEELTEIEREFEYAAEELKAPSPA